MHQCSNASVFKWHTLWLSKIWCSDAQMLRWSDDQILKCSIAQMFKCFNAQMLRCSNGQMFKCSDPQMLRCLDAKLLPIHRIQEASKSIKEHPRASKSIEEHPRANNTKSTKSIQEHQSIRASKRQSIWTSTEHHLSIIWASTEYIMSKSILEHPRASRIIQEMKKVRMNSGCAVMHSQNEFWLRAVKQS